MEDFDYSGKDNLEAMVAAKNYNRFLVELIRRHSIGATTVVDFGAGIGTYATALRNDGFKLQCVEIDEEYQSILKGYGLEVCSRLDLLKDDSVDVIYSLNVLEHIKNDEFILNVIRSKLKPGARVLIYVPAFNILYSAMDKHVGHYRRYTRSELIRKMESAGFSISKAQYIDSIGFFAALLFKYFGDSSGKINQNALVAYDKYIFPVSRAMDHVLKTIFGKNLFIVGHKL